MTAAATEGSTTSGQAADAVPVEPLLQAYFAREPVSAVAFFKAIRAAKVIRFKDHDVLTATELMAINDRDCRRLLALATQNERPDAVSRWLWPAIRERLRAFLPEDFESPELDAERTFATLNRMLATRLASADADQRREGETLLLLALAWLVSQRSLDAWITFSELKHTFFSDAQQAVRAARRVLLRGKITEVKNATAVAALADHTVREARARENDEARRQLSLQSKLTTNEAELETLRSTINLLNNERDAHVTQLAAVQA